MSAQLDAAVRWMLDQSSKRPATAPAWFEEALLCCGQLDLPATKEWFEQQLSLFTRDGTTGPWKDVLAAAIMTVAKVQIPPHDPRYQSLWRSLSEHPKLGRIATETLEPIQTPLPLR